ncbi:PQQ-binding-like beta-propeller repeat protein [Nocardioides currus]|uniref:Pyrrolo-quinoline quinone repeat domain-containing protein n=1 Tax=Nocardioides currus TaxID=2133958 RepID=A0A2R7YUT9_9ACTN|nr:PQQ-binding-like beta-propeller repeat protein [Nocardioides currus]PUA80064.1 hypothetical protein C7S10_16070 [Nocardioides currus]
MTTRTVRRWAHLVAAGALAAALAGCSDTEEPPDAPTPSSSDSQSDDPSEDATAEPVDESSAPADEISRAFGVPASKGPGGYAPPLGPVMTDDLIVFTDERDLLTAIDRTTGEQRWQVKRRTTGNNGDSPCELVHPTSDSEVVVLNHGAGELCGVFTVYSLADGSITEKYDSVPRMGRRIGFELTANSDLAEIDGRTYFVDADENLLRLEADGTTSSIGSPGVLLGADSDWNVVNLAVLPGTDVMFSRVVPAAEGDDELEFDEDEDGKLIGFRINDSELLELVWEQDVATLMSKASSPGHVRGKFQVSTFVDGMVVDQFRDGGAVRTRYRALDPETGELGSPGLTFGRNPDYLPGFAMQYDVDTSLPAADGGVFTPVVPRGSNRPVAVRRLDLASGEELWSWSIPGAAKRDVVSVGADLVTSSPDGSLVYVATAVDFQDRLWELDAGTGEVVRSWSFPDRDSSDLSGSVVTIDDGDVFRLSGSLGGDKVVAALYR